MAPPVIAVFGATGVVGRRVCEALAAPEPPDGDGDAGGDGGAPVGLRLVGRRRDALDAIAAALAGATTAPVAVAVAAAVAGDTAALARAFDGVRVVINAAGPLRDTAEPVLEAALAAGAHYIDVGGEQAALRALYERGESAVRHAGLVALPGAGLDAAIGDFAAVWAAEHLTTGDAVPADPTDRIAEHRPLDEVAVSYAFDDLALSAGSQRALFGAIGERALIWQRDRWEPGRAGDHRRINPGPTLGGERDALGFAGGAVITIPRCIAADRVATYVSAARSPTASAVLRWAARALPLLPRRTGEVLAPFAPDDAAYARTRFAVLAQVRRGFSAAQIAVHGTDVYRTTAAIAAWSARRLAARGPGPIGMRAPGELFRAQPALRAIARAAALTIEPSFG
jgi:hypothetical protein